MPQVIEQSLFLFPAGSGTPAGSRFIPVAKLGAKVVKSRKMGPLIYPPFGTIQGVEGPF